MKKLKIMLLSFALLAVVGSALAFKARFQTNFCTAVTNGQASNVCTSIGGVGGEKKFCPTRIQKTVAENTGATVFLCTTPAQDLDGGGVENDCTNLRCDDAITLYPN